MSVLGALAGGYAQAAELERRRQFEADQNQRQAALGMTKILLESPNVPPEYKGQLAQYGMDVINTPHGKKIPDFQKTVMSQLPALQTPGQTRDVQQPSLQLGGPSAPPPMPQNPAALGGGGAAASGKAPSLTQSGSAANGGAPGAMLPPVGPPPGVGGIPGAGMGSGGAGITVPGATSQVSLAPQQIAPAGQFHMLSPEELQQRETAMKLSQAAEISQRSGVPIERVLGYQSKFATFPWGGGVFNQNTGDIESAPTPKPMGQPIKMKAEDGTYHLYQRYQDNSLRPIDNPQGMSVPLPSAELPTVTSSSRDVNLETGASTTKTVRQKVQPGKPGAGPAVPPLPGGGVGTASATAAGATTPGARTRTDMAADRLLMSDAVKASQSARTMVNLLDTQQQYMDTITAGGAPTPRQDLSLIVAAVRAMNPGTVRLPNKELELELKAGSYGDRLKRQYEVATSGILPADQREDLFAVVNHETSNVAQDAAKNWKQNMRGKPLPPHLKRFAEAKTAEGAGGTQNGLIPVVDPAGQTHYFKDQAAADQFKAAISAATRTK
jgi:hypothetical protein